MCFERCKAEKSGKYQYKSKYYYKYYRYYDEDEKLNMQRMQRNGYQIPDPTDILVLPYIDDGQKIDVAVGMKWLYLDKKIIPRT